MSALAIDYTYRYAYPSQLDDSSHRLLQLATHSAEQEHPYFFSGTLMNPLLSAKLMLALVWILRSRFHVRPDSIPAGLADPIVTAHQETLRMEVFSACCSVYARVDWAPGGIDREAHGCGTTNVDFNPALIASLGKVRPSDQLDLSVGADELVLQRNQSPVVERRVKLPLRWLKGIGATASYGAQLKETHRISGPSALRFLRNLPRQIDHRTHWWVCRSGTTVRLSQRSGNDAVEVAGIERLRILEDLAPMARTLQIYGSSEVQASGWVLDFANVRLSLLLTHDVWRGFSGEGAGLGQLSSPITGSALTKARAALAWQSEISANAPETDALLRRGIDQYTAQGLVGFDLSSRCYFHRELPFDLSQLQKLEPRLKAARKLLEQSCVSAAGHRQYHVKSASTTHTVRVTDQQYRCTCPWFAKHQNLRGPCKHILAVQMQQGSTDGA